MRVKKISASLYIVGDGKTEASRQTPPLCPRVVLAAAKQAKKDGAVDIYRYRDMQSAREGRYGGLYHTIVLVMKDGQTHSFAGT